MVAQSDFEYFGKIVAEYRQLRAWTQDDVRRGGQGPSDTLLSEIEAGRWKSRTPGATLKKIDRGLQWPEGTAAKVLLEHYNPIRTEPRLDRGDHDFKVYWDAPEAALSEEAQAEIESLVEDFRTFLIVRAVRQQNAASTGERRRTLGEWAEDLAKDADPAAGSSGSVAHVTKTQPRGDFDVILDTNVALTKGQPYVDDETRLRAEERARAALQEAIEKRDDEVLERLDSDEADDSTDRGA